ncbi:hypothetical protein [Bradyrhizobium sp. AZCC 1693]|uniref:hypothetical protein n=1 Tax=Bradyrhizobium sp. AZCC 1693 TaxID=3117029 RepID=UPI002FF146A8
MPTSVELVDIVATALHWERTEVFHHARNLREAGVLTKGGRGITAPQMNLLDGANLICAVLAAKRVKESSEAVKGLADLNGVRQAFRSPEKNGWRFYPWLDRNGLLHLKPGHNVQEGIAALLDMFAREEELKRRWAEHLPHRDFELTAEFIVYYPKYYASISVRVEGVVSESWTYSLPRMARQKGTSHREGPSWKSGGCNERAFRKIANAFGVSGAKE